MRDLFFHRVGAGEEVFLGVDHVILGPGDATESDAWLERFVVDAQALDGLLDDRLLIGFVVDGEGSREADAIDAHGFDIATEDAYAEAVEGGEGGLGERGVAEDFLDTLGHFFGGLVGEGDGENVVRGDAALLDEVRDAVRDDARLARTGTGEQEHGAIDGEDAFALLRVHVREKIVHWYSLRLSF